MSNFVLNLARRGAGLAPAVAFRPPFVPFFAPNLGTAHTTEPEPATAEVPTHSGPAPAVVSVPPPRPATPAETPHQPPQSPHPSSSSQPRAGTAAPRSQSSQPVEPATPQPGQRASLTAAELQTPTPHHTPTPASPPVPPPRIEPTAQVSGDTRKSSHPADSPAIAAAQSPPAESAPRPQAPRRALGRSEPDPTTTQAATRTTLMPEAREAPEPEAIAKVQPTMPPASRVTHPPVITPAPVQSPMFPIPAEPTVSPSEPCSIQVRIGTIEVKASTPPSPPVPPPAPTPQGFDDYALLRNYVNWER